MSTIPQKQNKNLGNQSLQGARVTVSRPHNNTTWFKTEKTKGNLSIILQCFRRTKEPSSTRAGTHTTVNT